MKAVKIISIITLVVTVGVLAVVIINQVKKKEGETAVTPPAPQFSITEEA